MNETFNPFSMTGKRVLVTGASSGIGKKTAISLSKMGASVIITGRNEGRLADTHAQMSGGGHLMIIADISDTDDIGRLCSQLPQLDGVVHCAGVGSRVPCKFVTANEIDKVFKPNFIGPVLLQSALMSGRKLNKNSSVVFIASRAAEAPSVGNAVYSASKGAIISYARCLSREVAARGIRVNCICPAMVWTDLIYEGGASKDQLEAEQLKYPLRRYGRPEDIANLCIYLLSDASSWMTGSAIDITGGAMEL